MNELSISDRLLTLGVRHEPSTIDGKRNLFDAVGNHLGLFDAHEAVQYLKRTEK